VIAGIALYIVDFIGRLCTVRARLVQRELGVVHRTTATGRPDGTSCGIVGIVGAGGRWKRIQIVTDRTGTIILENSTAVAAERKRTVGRSSHLKTVVVMGARSCREQHISQI
jgi:hypothetical protein